MSELDETIEGLEWNRRLREARFWVSESEEESKTDEFGTLEVLIAFFVGLLFGVILTGILVMGVSGLV